MLKTVAKKPIQQNVMERTPIKLKRGDLDLNDGGGSTMPETYRLHSHSLEPPP